MKKQNPPILLAKDTINEQDINELAEWLKTNPRLTKGQLTIDYEQKFSSILGCKYSVFVNSGSSANLIMLYALIEEKRLKNKKIVIPALSWITDISPVIQFGLEPILCDCNLRDLSVDLQHLEEIFRKEKPSALILVSVLGMVPDMDTIIDLCKKYDVILLEDFCESYGSRYKNKNIGTFGLMSTCSSYFGHAYGTIEGGTVSTNDFKLYETLKMLRSHGWDRDISKKSQVELRKKHKISGFNSLYTFYKTGFNVRSTDLQAFIGIKQLDKTDFIVENRYKNFLKLNNLIKNKFWMPEKHEKLTSYHVPKLVSNLGYPIIHPKRDKIATALKADNVEVRPLISGSMGSQPFFIQRYGKQELNNVSKVDKYGMYVPNHPYLTDEEINRMANTVNRVINA